MHSKDSDGMLFADALFSDGRENGLAYIALTDHQVFYPGEDDGRDIAGSPVRLSGIEITSSSGHFLCIGLSRWSGLTEDAPEDEKPLSCGWMRQMAAKWHDAGAAIVIAHPCFEPWHWRCDNIKHIETKWFDALEIICDPGHERSPEASEKALKLWDSLLCRGWDVGGTGGSDFHGHGAPGRPGLPVTFICNDTPAPNNILRSLKSSRTCVGCGFFAGLESDYDTEKNELQWKPFIKVTDEDPGIGHGAAVPEIFPMTCELTVCGITADRQMFLSYEECAGVVTRRVPDIARYLSGCKSEGSWIRLDCRNEAGILTGFSEVKWFKDIQ